MIVRYLPLLCVLTAGCRDAQSPPLRVGVNPWMGYDPLLLAREQSLFDKKAMLVVQAAIEPNCVTYLLQAWGNSLRQLQAEPQKPVDLLAPSIELSSQIFLAALWGVRFISLAESTAKLDRSGVGLMHDANLLAGHLQQLGLLRHAPEWAALLDNRAVRLVLARP